MRARIKRRRGNGALRKAIVLAIFACLVWLAGISFLTVRETVRNVAQSEMENIANLAIHNAVSESIANGTDYADLVNVYRRPDGKIESLTLNAANANRLKSEIALKTLKYLSDNDRAQISIPLGNFTGSEFLLGIGPEVKLKIIPCNIANIDFESEFVQAGINQVRHTVRVRVNVDIGALMPRFEEISDITSSAIVTEAVIIGDVPETYLNIGGKDK